MPQRKGWLLMTVLLLATAGCSRLTFIKPNVERKDGEQIAQDYHVSDSPQVKQRLEAGSALQMATQRLRSGDLDEAERQSRRALKLEPQSPDAYTLLALVAERRGNAKLAGEHYRKAVELVPNRGAEQNNYGVWLCGNGLPAESLIWFDRALRDSGYATPGTALANAGRCALEAGQGERAERDLRQALVLDPANPSALASMAQSEFNAGRYFEARAFIERRMAAARANASVLKLASQIEERLGDKAAAGRYVQRLRAEFPDAPNAHSGGKTEQ